MNSKGYAIEWDKTGERKYETGTDRGVLYVQDGSGNYGDGVVWNGLTGVTESPSGAEPTDLYADNIKYATVRSAETFGCTIEAYMYPDEFAECDGSKEIAPGVYAGQQSRKAFGFSYRTLVGNDTQTEEDDGYKIHLIYGCTASPSEQANSTINESIEAKQLSWEVNTTPVNITGVPGIKATASLTIDSTKVGKENLDKLEKILYGSKEDEGSVTPARLPLPDEVIKLIKMP